MKKKQKRSPDYSLVRTSDYSEQQRHQRQQRQNTNLSFVELWQKIKKDSELQYLMVAISVLSFLILSQNLIFHKSLEAYNFNGVDLLAFGMWFVYYVYAQVKPVHSKNR